MPKYLVEIMAQLRFKPAEVEEILGLEKVHDGPRDRVRAEIVGVVLERSVPKEGLVRVHRDIHVCLRNRISGERKKKKKEVLLKRKKKWKMEQASGDGG